ncbi:DUF6735 family protein [Natrinema marinum]|uniref:DUF6735 family protein n=1 Tax=Natrinema marinum TaxID=2961598 RepID=UPI0020C866A4|nr:DUF6735 family protein [Natrinema marinum]
MGHRALVAYRRLDGRYDLRYSHWGGETLSLAAEISASTPLADGAVESEVLAASVTRDRILTDHLDPCVYETLYLVSPAAAYRVDAYYVCWLEWGDGRNGDRGAIVAVDRTDDGAIRHWFRATKTALADIVEMGVLSRRAAQAYLEARVCEEYVGIVYTYGDSSADGSGVADAPPSDRWLEDRLRGGEDRTEWGREVDDRAGTDDDERYGSR